MPYSGDISCTECWSALTQDSDAQLIDVRTSAEWSFVGLPDLSSIGKSVLREEWQQFPTMQVNPAFVDRSVEQLSEAGATTESSVFLLCRSGVRSIAAAEALSAAGFTKAYNVLGGFEGNPDEHGHRGNVSGWKYDDLPWRQG